MSGAVLYRLLITDCADSGPTSIAELKLFLSRTTPLTLDGAYASASSASTPANSASVAFDGDDMTYWESAGHPSLSAPEWLDCALGSAMSWVPMVTWFS